MIVLTVAIAYAAKEGSGGHEGKNWMDLIWRLINFVVLAWFLWWLLAKKVKDFFAGRRTDIKAALEKAVADKEEAEKKFKEYDSKLTRATEEIDQIREMIRTQGEVEKVKLIEDAKKSAEKMKEDTKVRMEQEFKNASNQLRKEAVQLSVEMADELLKRNITPADHENMVRDYIDKVVNKH
jgi:F-type H+-transporting ATPase subunit b